MAIEAVEMNTAPRVVAPQAEPEDFDTEGSLRPKRLEEYIGQEKAKENLKIYLQAAQKRREPLDHLLLYGPPGLGKTTMAGIVAAEMGVQLRITSGPAIEKQGDLAALLTNLQEGDVLFATKDGGYTWTEVERESAPGYEGVHSLTIGAEFVTPEVGFVAIRSSQEPELYRTEDGGVNWELCAFPESGAENEEFYTMAYPPEQKEDRLCVYLGMEEYSELGGTRLRYESEDLGKTWSYTGEVRRQ